MDNLEVRRATPDDLAAVSVLAGMLVRQHHSYDPQRFMLPPDVEKGYQWWLGKELENPEARVLVALQGGRVVGYAYGRLEPRDWNALRDACGALHDILVDPATRGHGAGRALVAAFMEEMRALGAPRIVLSTATRNEAAQRLFRHAGFRDTMIEMTCEL